jgi:lipoprotein NlpI
MKLFSLFVVTIVLLLLTGCGEPTESEIKQELVSVLKKDPHISKEFIETLDIKYGNGILALHNNCPKLVKLNDKRLSEKYKKREKAQKGDVWGKLLSVGMGDNIWMKSIEFRDACKQMRHRASDLAAMIEGVKEVKVLR